MQAVVVNAVLLGLLGLQAAVGLGQPLNALLHDLQARFAKHVFPGETLQVEMWAASPTKVIFQTRVKERNVLALSNAAVEFHQGRMQQLKGQVSRL